MNENIRTVIIEESIVHKIENRLLERRERNTGTDRNMLSKPTTEMGRRSVNTRRVDKRVRDG